MLRLRSYSIIIKIVPWMARHKESTGISRKSFKIFLSYKIDRKSILYTILLVASLGFCFLLLPVLLPPFVSPAGRLAQSVDGCCATRTLLSKILFRWPCFKAFAFFYCLSFSHRLLHHSADFEGEAEEGYKALGVFVVVKFTCCERSD